MNCPICNISLTVTERRGVEVDFCPKCRGVWLDRGELDKIIERSMVEMSSRQYLNRHDDRHNHGYDKHHDGNNGDYRKKIRGFFHDIFD